LRTPHALRGPSHIFRGHPHPFKAPHPSYHLVPPLQTPLPLLICLNHHHHELSMICRQLPRSWRVKKLRQGLSSQIITKPLPSPFKGWFRDLPDHLSTVIEGRDFHLQCPVEVKLAGDGAPMHRSTSNILLSFSLPSLDPAATSSIYSSCWQCWVSMQLTPTIHVFIAI
jgi:hypothetical protein